MVVLLTSLSFFSLNLALAQTDLGYANIGPLPTLEGVKRSGVDKSLLELTLKCDHLRKMDLRSSSDPQCIIFSRHHGEEPWQQVGATEIVQDNNSPAFTKKYLVDWNFDRPTQFKFELRDDDGRGKYDFLGQAITSDAHIASRIGAYVTYPLTEINGTTVIPRSSLSVLGREIKNTNKLKLQLTVSAKNIPKSKGMFAGTADSYLEFVSVDPISKVERVIGKTQTINDSKSPYYGKVILDLDGLTDNLKDRTFKVRLKHFHTNEAHKIVGEVLVSPQQLLQNPTLSLDFDKANPGKERTLNFIGTSEYKEHSFLDYLQGGCQMGLCVSIDFTGSNGDPRYSNSLHYSCGDEFHQLSQYEKGICAIGNFLEVYDNDKKFPTTGFGAIIPGSFGKVNHCFALNQVLNVDGGNSEIPGVNNILEALKKVKGKIEFKGPTNFAPTIYSNINEVKRNMTSRPMDYKVLLILTDGQISDFAETKKAIAEASHLPMSIIIVGVGDADFSSMDELDGDENPLPGAARDIVQFVKLKDFFNTKTTIGQKYDLLKYQKEQAAFTSAVMAELPKQVQASMADRGIVPAFTAAKY